MVVPSFEVTRPVVKGCVPAVACFARLVCVVMRLIPSYIVTGLAYEWADSRNPGIYPGEQVMSRLAASFNPLPYHRRRAEAHRLARYDLLPGLKSGVSGPRRQLRRAQATDTGSRDCSGAAFSADATAPPRTAKVKAAASSTRATGTTRVGRMASTKPCVKTAVARCSICATTWDGRLAGRCRVPPVWPRPTSRPVFAASWKEATKGPRACAGNCAA